jgi:hypothetical protein
MAAPELTLSRRQGPEQRDTWQCRSSPQQGGEVQGRGTRGGAGPHLCREVWFEATTYVAARECTPSPCLDLELICGGTPPSGYRRRPPGPPRERLRTRRWGQLFGAPLGYLELFTWQSIAGPRQVPELEVRECPPSTLRNVDDGPLGGARAGDPGASHHQC